MGWWVGALRIRHCSHLTSHPFFWVTKRESVPADSQLPLSRHRLNTSCLCRPANDPISKHSQDLPAISSPRLERLKKNKTPLFCSVFQEKQDKASDEGYYPFSSKSSAGQHHTQISPATHPIFDFICKLANVLGPVGQHFACKTAPPAWEGILVFNCISCACCVGV